MASGDLIKCGRCRWDHQETKVTAVGFSGNRPKIAMVVEFVNVCRAPRVAMIKVETEVVPYYPPNRGKEVEDRDTCLAGARKPRH